MRDQSSTFSGDSHRMFSGFRSLWAIPTEEHKCLLQKTLSCVTSHYSSVLESGVENILGLSLHTHILWWQSK